MRNVEDQICDQVCSLVDSGDLSREEGLAVEMFATMPVGRRFIRRKLRQNKDLNPDELAKLIADIIQAILTILAIFT